jgi:hypothetical protein
MRYETTTKLSTDEALARAEQFFGSELGLIVRTRSPGAIAFEGGGGHVVVGATGERPTAVELETREWDRQVTEFMRSLPR